VNEDDRTALHKAAYNGNPEIIEILLKNGADPRFVDSSGNRAVDYMENYECKMIIYRWKTEWTDNINRKREEEAKKLVNNFLNWEELTREMREKLRLYLIEKARSGEYNKIHEIVSIGKASIEIRDNNGSSLLSIAVSAGHYKWVEQMINDLSPNINTKDHKGWTPIMKAVIQNSLKIARLLIEAGADLNVKNNLNLKAIELIKTNEMRDYIRDESRKASFYDFEQMLNFQANLKDPLSFLNGSVAIFNQNQDFDNEKGDLSKMNNSDFFRKRFEKKIKKKSKSRLVMSQERSLPTRKPVSKSRTSLSKSVVSIRNMKENF